MRHFVTSGIYHSYVQTVARNLHILSNCWDMRKPVPRHLKILQNPRYVRARQRAYHSFVVNVTRLLQTPAPCRDMKSYTKLRKTLKLKIEIDRNCFHIINLPFNCFFVIKWFVGTRHVVHDSSIVKRMGDLVSYKKESEEFIARKWSSIPLCILNLFQTRQTFVLVRSDRNEFLELSIYDGISIQVRFLVVFVGVLTYESVLFERLNVQL